jgi:acetyl-CoA C-acetyltransferase
VVQRVKLLGHPRPGQIVPDIPRNAEPRTGLSMGEHQARTTKQWQITREAQDELAAASHLRAAAAYERGFFDDLVTPFLGLERDQNLRPDSSVEKLAKLKPVFGERGGDEASGRGRSDAATMTAGNSTPLTDGAATVLLASDEWAAERGLPVLAHITHAEEAAVDYVHGDDGLLVAPVYAVPRLLRRAGLGLGDFDLYEIHEAFAAQVLTTLAAWEDEEFCRSRLGLEGALGGIDREKLNVAGSSLAVGHPFAATGARILATAAKLLAHDGDGSAGSRGAGPRRARGAGPRRALISICAAGGQGVAAIVER